MAWVYLFFAGLLEIVWAILLKYSEGFTKLVPTVVMLIAMVASVSLLAHAMRTLPVGTAYAIWTGLGALGVALLGMILFKEPATLFRLVSLGFIILGIVGLKLVG